LVASVGRFVHFGPVPEVLRLRINAAARISAEYQDHTRPGITGGEMLQLAKKWFAENGFEGYWENHHQGGAIGYAEREWIAVPDSSQVVHERQAFAWNPIIKGALSFDTVIAFRDYVENITQTPDWPTIPVAIGSKTYAMPDVLVR
jgi:antitoxin VapB